MKYSDKATAAACNAPMMMFAQRFTLYLNTRESTIMAIAVSINIAAPNKKLGVS
jgi:hypothetical protein